MAGGYRQERKNVRTVMSGTSKTKSRRQVVEDMEMEELKKRRYGAAETVSRAKRGRRR
jgi:hypothetical protein